MTFSVYNDTAKRTSGQRFWGNLAGEFASHTQYDATSGKAIFFNISAPLSKIVRAKIARRKVILRLDGIYHERLSPPAIQAMHSRLGQITMTIVWSIFGPVAWGSLLMNLITHNFKLLVKVWFADGIVYQSHFSQALWQRYYPGKPSVVALNGGNFQGRKELPPVSKPIGVLTTYESWRPAKRLHDLVVFVKQHNVRTSQSIRLLILGYTPHQRPANLTAEDVQWIESSGEVEILPPFTDYTSAIIARVKAQHLFMTFSFNDNCPNVVVEAMSYGLPVIALASGGIPQIVGDAGEMVPLDAKADYFCCFDRCFDYPGFDGGEVSARIAKILEHYGEYCERVEKRFQNELNLKQVVTSYLKILELDL